MLLFQDRFPFGPRAMVVVSWYLSSWVDAATRGISEGNTDSLLRCLGYLLNPEYGGLGFEVMNAGSDYDWEIGEVYTEIGIEAFENGSRFVVEVEDYSMLHVPVRIFTPREFQGLLHWGLSWENRDKPKALALIRQTEAKWYDLDGLDQFIDDRIQGRVAWEYGYPFDNPTALAYFSKLHPGFPYDNVDLQTSRHEA